jgi:response regulator RpfG family c-di-GMP phosphodiesterase
MIYAVLAAKDKQTFEKMAEVLQQSPMDIQWTDTGKSVLERISRAGDKGEKIDLVITDETLADMTGRELVAQVTMTSPMTSCVAVSTLSADEFHETYEGYGVLMQLPPAPDAESGEKLVAILKKLNLIVI